MTCIYCLVNPHILCRALSSRQRTQDGSSISMVARRRPSLTLLRLPSISEDYVLDLGTESPSSILEPSSAAAVASPDEWSKAGIIVNTNGPTRRRSWRSLSWLQEKHRTFVGTQVDGDCGICFETAILPARVKCCLQVFCSVHLSDWLGSEQSDGLCPSCKRPCSISRDTIPLDLCALMRSSEDLHVFGLRDRSCTVQRSSSSVLTCPPASPHSWFMSYNVAGEGARSIKRSGSDSADYHGELFGFGIARALIYLAVAFALLVLFTDS